MFNLFFRPHWVSQRVRLIHIRLLHCMNYVAIQHFHFRLQEMCEVRYLLLKLSLPSSLSLANIRGKVTPTGGCRPSAPPSTNASIPRDPSWSGCRCSARGSSRARWRGRLRLRSAESSWKGTRSIVSSENIFNWRESWRAYLQQSPAGGTCTAGVYNTILERYTPQ